LHSDLYNSKAKKENQNQLYIFFYRSFSQVHDLAVELDRLAQNDPHVLVRRVVHPRFVVQGHRIAASIVLVVIIADPEPAVVGKGLVVVLVIAVVLVPVVVARERFERLEVLVIERVVVVV
jgi:hypothetical protein